MGHSWPIFVFAIKWTQTNALYKRFSNDWIKNRISGVESDQSTNFPQPLHNLKFIQALVFKADHIRFIESSPSDGLNKNFRRPSAWSLVPPTRRPPDGAETSVARLGEFYKFSATICLTKVAQISL